MAPNWVYKNLKGSPFFYIEREMCYYYYYYYHYYYYYYYPVSEDKYKIVPSLLASLLMVSLTSQESHASQQDTPHNSHPSSFAPHLQLTILQT